MLKETKMAKNSSGGNGGNGGNGDGMSAKLKHSVAGCAYLDKDVRGCAGMLLAIEGVEVRKMDQEKNPHLRVRGKSGCLHSVPLVYFESHPPVDELRKVAVTV